MLAVTGRGLPALLLFLAFPLAASGGSPPLALTVTPSRIEFTRDDAPSALKLTLELAASAVTPVTVSTYGGGSIHVRRLTRNGVWVKPQRDMMVSFFEDPCLGNIGLFLVTLAPGESARVWDHTLGLERGLSGDPELLDIRCEKGAAVHNKGVLVYSLPTPGVYELQLTYRYTGADGGCEHVFRGDVPSNVITLHLR